jgi:hypothetical protein
MGNVGIARRQRNEVETTTIFGQLGLAGRPSSALWEPAVYSGYQDAWVTSLSEHNGRHDCEWINCDRVWGSSAARTRLIAVPANTTAVRLRFDACLPPGQSSPQTLLYRIQQSWTAATFDFQFTVQPGDWQSFQMNDVPSISSGEFAVYLFAHALPLTSSQASIVMSNFRLEPVGDNTTTGLMQFDPKVRRYDIHPWMIENNCMPYPPIGFYGIRAPDISSWASFPFTTDAPKFTVVCNSNVQIWYGGGLDSYMRIGVRVNGRNWKTYAVQGAHGGDCFAEVDLSDVPGVKDVEVIVGGQTINNYAFGNFSPLDPAQGADGTKLKSILISDRYRLEPKKRTGGAPIVLWINSLGGQGTNDGPFESILGILRYSGPSTGPVIGYGCGARALFTDWQLGTGGASFDRMCKTIGAVKPSMAVFWSATTNDQLLSVGGMNTWNAATLVNAMQNDLWPNMRKYCPGTRLVWVDLFPQSATLEARTNAYGETPNVYRVATGNNAAAQSDVIRITNAQLGLDVTRHLQGDGLHLNATGQRVALRNTEIVLTATP